jgi:hypothetical protein
VRVSVCHAEARLRTSFKALLVDGGLWCRSVSDVSLGDEGGVGYAAAEGMGSGDGGSRPTRTEDRRPILRVSDGVVSFTAGTADDNRTGQTSSNIYSSGGAGR